RWSTTGWSWASTPARPPAASPHATSGSTKWSSTTSRSAAPSRNRTGYIRPMHCTTTGDATQVPLKLHRFEMHIRFCVHIELSGRRDLHTGIVMAVSHRIRDIGHHVGPLDRHDVEELECGHVYAAVAGEHLRCAPDDAGTRADRPRSVPPASSADCLL